MPRRFHVRCRHLSCDYHVHTTGGEAAYEALVDHEGRTGHDVDVIAHDDVDFVSASEIVDELDEVEA